MQLSIVTINYNGSENTINLLKSFENQALRQGSGQADKNFQIIVVDNASEENDFERLKSALPTGLSSIKLIRNSQNLGFSGGCNVGIRQALESGARWVILLNNDTWVEGIFMERLRGVLTLKNRVLGIPLIEGDKMAYCGGIRWLKPTLIHITDIASRLSTVPTCDVGNPQIYAIGGAVAIHRDVFDKVGFLDEKYFLYFEDADFSVRARKAGFDISIADPPAGGLNVHHHISSSTKKLGSPLLLHYHYRNALYFNFKNGPWYIKFLVWPWSWVIIAKQLTKLVTNKNQEQSKAILSGVVDFYKNKMGKI